jgi:hypothetical protein
MLTENPFPEISIKTIQEVATSRCGISPLEVAQELLLARAKEQDLQKNNGSGSTEDHVTNG